MTISDNIKLLSERIETEVNKLSHDKSADGSQTDSLIYIGNWQDAIPRSIWIDTSLSDSDVRSWGIIRTQAISGSAVMLSLNKLLAETLGYSNATISRILYVLRLTRWISLCSKIRTGSGQFRGNIYAIHDSPVLLNDAIYLDSQYIDFVKQQTTHNNKSIRTLAQTIWQVISESVYQETLFSSTSPVTETNNSVEQLTHPSKKNVKQGIINHVYNLNVDENSHVQKLNVDTKHHVYNLNVDDEKYNNEENQQDSIHVYNLNVDAICSSSSSSSFTNTQEKEIKKTPTTNSEGISFSERKKFQVQKNLIYPKSFNASEKKLACMYLEKIEIEHQQSFLDETAAQIKLRNKTNKPVRNPIGYLAWLCNQHGEGNTFLTSAYLKHQELRERKQKNEQSLKRQQEAMTRASLEGKDIKNIDTPEKDERNKNTEKPPGNRWEGMNQGIKPRQPEEPEDENEIEF